MKAFITALAATALVAVPAFAQEGMQMQLPFTPEIFAGVGGGNYTGDLGSITNSGVAWDARVGINPWPFFAAELNYQGLNNGVGSVIQSNGTVVTGQTLLKTEVTIDGRLGYPFHIGGQELKPYGFLGFGYAYVGSNNFLSSVGLGSSSAFAVPLGVGVGYQITNIFAADGRFTFNGLTGIRSAIAPTGSDWNFLFSVGARFGTPGA